MKVFYLPSFYPSANHPIYGVFVKEQIEILAKHLPESLFGVSTWGQGDPMHMLWVRDVVGNMAKLRRRQPIGHHRQKDNIHHYFDPVYTWTQKLGGNMPQLFRTADRHFKHFVNLVGPVDVLHAQATYPGAFLAKALSEKYKVPYVVTLRMSPWPFEQYLHNGKLKDRIRQVLEPAQLLIATSSSLEENVRSFGFTKVTTIHNPVDTDLFYPLAKQTTRKTKGVRIFSVGRMERQKGYDLLIRAVAHLGKSFEGEIYLGGTGSQLSTYQRLAQREGVADRFQWLGLMNREQVRAHMQQCDFYVLPSRHETFGNVLLEALACGKPVLATRCGGPEDIVSAQVGKLVHTEDILGLATGITTLSKCYARYNPLHLKLYVDEKFGPNRFVDKTVINLSSLIIT